MTQKRTALERVWLKWQADMEQEPEYSVLRGVLDDCTQRAASILHNTHVNHGLRNTIAQLALMQLFLIGRIEAMASALPYLRNPEDFGYEWRYYQECLKDVMDAFHE